MPYYRFFETLICFLRIAFFHERWLSLAILTRHSPKNLKSVYENRMRFEFELTT